MLKTPCDQNSRNHVAEVTLTEILIKICPLLFVVSQDYTSLENLKMQLHDA